MQQISHLALYECRRLRCFGLPYKSYVEVAVCCDDVSVEAPCLAYLSFCPVAIYGMAQLALGDRDEHGVLSRFTRLAVSVLICGFHYFHYGTKRKGGDGLTAVTALEQCFYAFA